METVNLLVVSVSAIAALFLLLAALVVGKWLILRIFPAKEEPVDPAAIAAIASVVRARFPGTRVTHIKVEK